MSEDFRPNPEQETSPPSQDSNEQGAPEVQQQIKTNNDRFAKSTSTGDVGGGLAAMALIFGAIFMWRREQREAKARAAAGPPEIGGVDVRALADPETEIHRVRTLIQGLDGDLKLSEVHEKQLKGIADGATEPQAKKLDAVVQQQLGKLLEDRAKITGERATLQGNLIRLEFAIKNEQVRRNNIMTTLQQNIHSDSIASTVTLDGGNLRIELRNPLSEANAKNLRAALEPLNPELAEGITAGTTDVFLPLPGEFWSQWTSPPIANAGRQARLMLFAWITGQSAEQVEQVEKKSGAEVKTGEEQKKADGVKKTEEAKKTDEVKKAAEAKAETERKNAEASNVLRSPNGQLLTRFLANRNATPVSAAATEAVYRVPHAMENGPVSHVFIRIHADPAAPGRFLLSWNSTLPRSAAEWQPAASAGNEANRKQFPNLQALMNELQGLQGADSGVRLERERVFSERREAGVRYLLGMGCSMMGNSRGETVLTYRQTLIYPPTTVVFRFHEGAWMWAESPEARGTELRLLNQCEADIARGLQQLNGDGEALRKILPLNALHTQRRRIGEVKLRELGAVPRPQRPDVFQFTSGNRTVYFTYVAMNDMGWTWTDNEHAYLPTTENLAWNANQCWMAITRLYIPAGGVPLRPELVACNDVARTLQTINGGTAEFLQTPAMTEMLDRDTRLQGSMSLLTNHSGVEVRPGIVRVQRGPVQAFFVRGPAGPDGRRSWLWTATLDRARAGIDLVPLTAEFPGQREAGSEPLVAQLQAIARELHSLNTGTATEAAQIALRQHSIRDTINAQRRVELSAGKALVMALRRSGANLQIPLSRDDAPRTRQYGESYPTWVGDYWVAGATPDQQSEIGANTANLKTPEQAMDLALTSILVGEEAPAHSPLGVFVKDPSGEILSTSGGQVLWPRAGESGNWISLARTRPLEAVQIIAGLPSPPVSEVFRKQLQSYVNVFCDGRLAAPQFIGQLPDTIRQAQLREQILRTAIAQERNKTEEVLMRVYSQAEQARHDNLFRDRDNTVFGVIAARLITDWGATQDRQYAMTTQTSNICQRNYRLLHRGYPSAAPPMEQLEFLVRLRIEVDTRHHDREINDMCANVMRQADRFTSVARPAGAGGEAILSLTQLDKIVSTMVATASVVGGNDPQTVAQDYALNFIPGYNIYAAIDPIMNAPANISKAYAAENNTRPVRVTSDAEIGETQDKKTAQELEKRRKELDSL